MAETNPDPPVILDQSSTKQDASEFPQVTLDQSDSLNDKPPNKHPKDWDEIKQQLEALIRENRHHQSSLKRFLFISTVVALVAISAWYVHSIHSEVVGLRGEIKTIQTWMAVKMDKLKDKTLTKVDEVHNTVVTVVKESSAKQTKILKSIEGKLKR